jgi:hypothetical protein
MKSISLYNNDGTLSTEAQLLISGRPDSISYADWRKRIKSFMSQLSTQDVKEYKRLRTAATAARHYAKHPETYNDWNQHNKEKRRTQYKFWRRENKNRINESRRTNYKSRIETDELYAVKHYLRSVVSGAFKRIGQHKPTDTLKLLGCTWLEAKVHIEKLFVEGMSWNNHGEWHIDHIRPVSSFSLNELHLMNNINNLQPLWAKENLTKYNKWMAY